MKKNNSGCTLRQVHSMSDNFINKLSGTKPSITFLTLLLLFGLATSVQATMITYEFSGTVTFSSSASVTANSLYEGSFTIDDNMDTDTDGRTCCGYFQDAISMFEITYFQPGNTNIALALTGNSGGWVFQANAYYHEWRGGVKGGGGDLFKEMKIEFVDNHDFDYFSDSKILNPFLPDLSAASINSRTFVSLNQSTINGSLSRLEMVTPIPEPSSMLLFGTGLASFVGYRFRRKKSVGS